LHKWRPVEAQGTITVERAMVLVTALAQAVAGQVTDRKALSAINAEFREIVGGGGAQEKPPGSP